MKPFKNFSGLGGYFFLAFLIFPNAALCQSPPELACYGSLIDSSRWNPRWAEFTSDGKHIVTYDFNKDVTSQLKSNYEGKAKFWELEFSSTRTWDISTGKVVTWDNVGSNMDPFNNEEIYDTRSSTIDFYPVENLVLTETDSLRIWKMDTGELIYSMPNEGRIFTFYEKWILIESNDSLKIWDKGTGKLLSSLIGKFQDISPNGKWVLTESNDSLSMWDTKTAQLIYSFKGEWGDFSSDGKWIFSLQENDRGGKQRVNIIEAKLGTVHQKFVGNYFFNRSDSRYLFISREFDYFSRNLNWIFKVVDIASGTIIISFRLGVGRLWPWVSQDGNWLVNVRHIENKQRNKYIARIWQVNTGTMVKKITWQTCQPADLNPTFSPDNKYFSMSCDPYSNGLDSFSDGSVWESATGRQLYSVNIGYSRYRYNVKFSPDSKWIVTRGDSTKIWEIETGRLIKAIRGEFGGFHPYLPLILVYGKSGYSLVSLNTGATLLSCDYNDLSDWVVTHPSRLFDASPGAMEKLYFIQDGEKIEFNRLKDKYYEPGLWEKVMSGEPLRVVEN